MMIFSAVLGVAIFGVLVYLGVIKWIDYKLKSRLRSDAFKHFYESCIREVVNVCEEQKVTYWFTEGTLIGLLRYGANHHESHIQSIDEDIDLMIEVKNQDEWLSIKKKLIQGLEQRGWGGLYERTTSSSKKGRIDKMQMWKYDKRTHTHVDFHSYFTDQEFAYSHKEPDSYPFQYWGGKLSLEKIYPMKKCLCYGREVPCPIKAVEILKGWNGGEYIESNIAFPPHDISLEEQEAIVKRIKELDANGYVSMIEEIKP